METVPVVTVSIIPQPVYSPVLSFVQICCPQTFVLGSLLDTERGVVHIPGHTNYVLMRFIYTKLPLGDVALRLGTFDTQK